MRLASVAVLLLLAGCLSSPAPTDPKPAAETPPVPIEPSLRLDRAAATYQTFAPGRATEARIALAPADVWSRAFDRVPGLVAVLDERTTLTDVETGSRLGEQEATWRIGLDLCNTPLWRFDGGDDGDGVVGFFDRGTPQAPGWREAILALQRPGLPSGALAAVHGDFTLHVRHAGGDEWLAKWTTGPDPGAWADAVRLVWPAADAFPSEVHNGTEAWQRTDHVNTGSPPADCFAGRDVSTVAWGPWGPEVDPPLPISWSAIVAYVREDATLLATQAFLDEHPDAFLAAVLVNPESEDGLPDIPGVLEDNPSTWSFHVGAPGLQSGPIVLCRVRDGGGELPDAYACTDNDSTWQRDEALPEPDWSTLQAHDPAPWFDFVTRYGPSPDWLLYVLEGPDGNGRPVAVKLATASDYYAADFRYVHWDPQGPDSYVALGFRWDEFLTPPT